MSVTLTERLHERDVGKGVCRVGEQCKVGDELVLGSDLQIVSGFCQAFVHCILFQVHESGVLVGLRIGIAIAEIFKMPVVFTELTATLLEFLGYLAPLLLFLLVQLWIRERGVDFVRNLRKQ